jgi:hypothetical protein
LEFSDCLQEEISMSNPHTPLHCHRFAYRFFSKPMISFSPLLSVKLPHRWADVYNV